MNPEEFNIYIQQWIDLSRNGKPLEAEQFYYAHIFNSVIERFKKKYAQNRKGELLVSLLGYSPEPIILTAKALQPETHLIISNPIKEEIVQILDKYLANKYRLVILEKDDFLTIYKTIKESLSDYPTGNITIDITGGKKSMVASAAIFGKDYGSRIVYVDFAEYLKDLRKPIPGTELLNVVYNPLKDQPENNFLK
ncbi:MAG: hypothetical protein Q7U54_00220 [Bacteroidales bacterium]|nr:hypothetical protein [Bacteroidales bacterium]